MSPVILHVGYGLFCVTFTVMNVYVGHRTCWCTCLSIILRTNLIFKAKHAYFEHLNERYQLFFMNFNTTFQVNQKTEARRILSLVQKLFSTKLCKLPSKVRW